MKIQPVKGTCDYLPRQQELRDYLESVILRVYRSAGYERISTPALEDAENIDKSDGGDNLNLIFKVLKRGEKLDAAFDAGDKAGLSDMGLRYDLTLPLSRYFACHQDKLFLPAKCIQIGRVWRAERPQKGRNREFVQCDIDILGSSSTACEVDLICTTARALTEIGMDKFEIHISDRELLAGVLSTVGVPEEMRNTVSVSLDKLDKIGLEGVNAELTEKGLDPTVIDRLSRLMGEGEVTLEKAEEYLTDRTPAERLRSIMEQVSAITDGGVRLVFDLTLIRGQGYYTGPVFEVRSTEFRGAIAGGGRYDHLIGKFIGRDVPAVGFSIGFERIFAILSERGFTPGTERKKIALLFYPDQLTAAAKAAEELRASADVTLIEKTGKVGKLIAKCEAYGFDALAEMTDAGVTVKDLAHA
ncbi:MAG: ATP phosphoribosyltransferase regulatory subunit [Clostridia bacterium]|nr:ATP phosphoribosyltransferase regulatory subunit [Clostridia bacterium]MDY6184522.1 ATP phosphoribosyltransferase regulatory subunit [Eubacteriales bacterium]